MDFRSFNRRCCQYRIIESRWNWTPLYSWIISSNDLSEITKVKHCLRCYNEVNISSNKTDKSTTFYLGNSQFADYIYLPTRPKIKKQLVEEYLERNNSLLNRKCQGCKFSRTRQRDFIINLMHSIFRYFTIRKLLNNMENAFDLTKKVLFVLEIFKFCTFLFSSFFLAGYAKFTAEAV